MSKEQEPRLLKRGDKVALNVAEARKFGLPDWYGTGTVLVNQRKEMVHVRFNGGLEIQLHREYLRHKRKETP